VVILSTEFSYSLSSGGKALADVAAAHGATPHQVALAFLTHRASVFAIPKATALKHIEDNAGAAKLALSAEALATLDAAFPRGPAPRSLPMI
jgi:aryl-alcohol dehydrogenase-like predicted oxidoreductase